jgi:hypothetical protein
MSAPDLAGRLIDQVQRFGLASATTVIDRYIAAAEAALGTDPLELPASPGTEQLSEAAALAGNAYLALLDSAAAMARRDRDRLARVDLPAVTAGSRSTGSLFLHNTTADAVADARVMLGPFLGASGAMTEAAVTIAPSSLDLAAGASGQVLVHVDVPGAQAPGDYYAVALASVAAEDPVVVRVAVLPAAGRP